MSARLPDTADAISLQITEITPCCDNLVTQSLWSRFDGDQVNVNSGIQTIQRAPSAPKYLGWNSFDS